MISFLIRAAIFLGSAAVGLLVASLILSGFSAPTSGFIVAVVIFAIAQDRWAILAIIAFAAIGAVALVAGRPLLFPGWPWLLLGGAIGLGVGERGTEQAGEEQGKAAHGKRQLIALRSGSHGVCHAGA